jgi:hypothetical protein
MCSANIAQDLKDLCLTKSPESDINNSVHGLCLFSETEILSHKEEDISASFLGIFDSSGATVESFLPEQTTSPDTVYS